MRLSAAEEAALAPQGGEAGRWPLLCGEGERLRVWGFSALQVGPGQRRRGGCSRTLQAHLPRTLQAQRSRASTLASPSRCPPAAHLLPPAAAAVWGGGEAGRWWRPGGGLLRLDATGRARTRQAPCRRGQGREGLVGGARAVGQRCGHAAALPQPFLEAARTAAYHLPSTNLSTLPHSTARCCWRCCWQRRARSTLATSRRSRRQRRRRRRFARPCCAGTARARCWSDWCVPARSWQPFLPQLPADTLRSLHSHLRHTPTPTHAGHAAPAAPGAG